MNLELEVYTNEGLARTAFSVPAEMKRQEMLQFVMDVVTRACSGPRVVESLGLWQGPRRLFFVAALEPEVLRRMLPDLAWPLTSAILARRATHEGL
jgi:hypothetical protein